MSCIGSVVLVLIDLLSPSRLDSYSFVSVVSVVLVNNKFFFFLTKKKKMSVIITGVAFSNFQSSSFQMVYSIFFSLFSPHFFTCDLKKKFPLLLLLLLFIFPF